MRLKVVASSVLALAAALCVAGAASAAPVRENTELLVGPPITDIESPYAPYQSCLKEQMSPRQRSTVFSVGYFVDKTGKTNYVSDSGTGTFSTQGTQDMLYTALAQTGVQVSDTSLEFRLITDWFLGKAALVPYDKSKPITEQNKPFQSSMTFPDVIVSGAITSFDIGVSSGGADARVYGIGGGRRMHRILVGMEGRAVEMANGMAGRQAGTIRATTRFQKQIVGFENELGATSFFGSRSSRTLFEINLGERKNEAIQYIERIMVDRLAGDLVAETFGITQCRTQRDYGDSLALPN